MLVNKDIDVTVLQDGVNGVFNKQVVLLLSHPAVKVKVSLSELTTRI